MKVKELLRDSREEITEILANSKLEISAKSMFDFIEELEDDFRNVPIYYELRKEFQDSFEREYLGLVDWEKFSFRRRGFEKRIINGSIRRKYVRLVVYCASCY